MKLYENGAYLLNGKEVIIDGPEAQAAVKRKTGMDIDKQTAQQETIAYGILKEHNTSGNMDKLQIKFDKLTVCPDTILLFPSNTVYSTLLIPDKLSSALTI